MQKQANRTLNSKTASNGNVFLMPNGQRVPVLFRLRNIQQKAAAQPLDASRLNTAAATNAHALAPVNAAPSATENNYHVDEAEEMSGPSWMRRNAYRMTVFVMLIVTAGLAYNNFVRTSSSQLSNDETKLAVNIEMPPSDVTLASKSETPMALDIKPIFEETPTAPPKLIVQKPKPPTPTIATANQPPWSPSDMLESTDDQLVLAQPAVQTNASQIPETNFDSFRPMDVQLLSPANTATIGQTVSIQKPVQPTQANVTSEPASTWSKPNTFSQENTFAQNSNLQSSESTAAMSNRYDAMSDSLDDSTLRSPQVVTSQTKAPDLDPTHLFSIWQEFQQSQTPEQAVRGTRQISTAGFGTPVAAPPAAQNTVPQPTAATYNPAINYSNTNATYPGQGSNTGYQTTSQYGALYAAPTMASSAAYPMNSQPAFNNQQSSPYNDPNLYSTPSGFGVPSDATAGQANANRANLPQNPQRYQPVYSDSPQANSMQTNPPATSNSYYPAANQTAPAPTRSNYVPVGSPTPGGYGFTP